MYTLFRDIFSSIVLVIKLGKYARAGKDMTITPSHKVSGQETKVKQG